VENDQGGGPVEVSPLKQPGKKGNRFLKVLQDKKKKKKNSSEIKNVKKGFHRILNFKNGGGGKSLSKSIGGMPRPAFWDVTKINNQSPRKTNIFCEGFSSRNVEEWGKQNTNHSEDE